MSKEGKQDIYLSRTFSKYAIMMISLIGQHCCRYACRIPSPLCPSFLTKIRHAYSNMKWNLFLWVSIQQHSPNPVICWRRIQISTWRPPRLKGVMYDITEPFSLRIKNMDWRWKPNNWCIICFHKPILLLQTLDQSTGSVKQWSEYWGWIIKLWTEVRSDWTSFQTGTVADLHFCCPEVWTVMRGPLEPALRSR